MVKKILIPFDGSEHSKKAILFAADVAQHHNSELFLVHVVKDKDIPLLIEQFVTKPGELQLALNTNQVRFSGCYIPHRP